MGTRLYVGNLPFSAEESAVRALFEQNQRKVEDVHLVTDRETGRPRGFGFVGGVGSRAKAARTRARLRAKGVDEADVGRVRMPIGLDIGARSPAEIAVAIAAELVAWRSGAAARQPIGREDDDDGGDADEAGEGSTAASDA